MKTREAVVLISIIAICALIGIGIGMSYYSNPRVMPSQSMMPTVMPPLSERTLSSPKKISAPKNVVKEMTLQEALHGERIPNEISQELTIVTVYYWAFDGDQHTGQIIVQKDLAVEVKDIFDDIEDAHFPIEKIVPISQYDWSDEQSMKDNNTSAFNYRQINDQEALSMHSYGLAIDINPRLNPCIRHGITQPTGAKYDPTVPGTITADGAVVAAFKKRGWVWGGGWRKLKDWQHFERSL